MPNPREYYIKRQTNAGPNQGKWTVTCDSRGTLVGGLEKWQAKWICAAFNLAAEHPKHGDAIHFQQNWDISITSPGYSGPVYVRRKKDSK
ncbi:MAG: hypothetical protein V4671_28240 [Armatimonadota bacterium]